MSEKQKLNSLFSEFPPITKEEWEAKIHKDLKGADYEKKLVWRTLEGFNVQPYYRLDDLDGIAHLEALPGEFPYVRGNKVAKNEWFIRQDIIVDNLQEAHAKIKDLSNKGVTAFGLILKEGTVVTAAQFSNLLEGLDLEKVEVNLVSFDYNPEQFQQFCAFCDNLKTDKAKLNASFDFNALGYFTLHGVYPKPFNEEKAFAAAKELIQLAKDYKKTQVIAIRADYFHNGGGTAVQELAFALSAATEYISKLTDLGLTIDEIAPKIRFNFAVGANYFMEIAKFRAARYLWAKVVEAYSPKCEKSAKTYIHAASSFWNKTIFDAHVNMLRTTTEAMAATIAGVESLTLLPYDVAFETPSDFSERIARNQQIILKEESYFDKIIDPSAGSYYIETLTNSLIEHAWELFRKVEETGGYIAALKNNFIQQEITKVATKRLDNVSKRIENLLGTNQFPNFNERIETFVPAMVLQPYDLKEENATIATFPLYRAAQGFEKLRLQTQSCEVTPKVFMLSYGNPAMSTARAMFAGNFFGCAGYEIVNNPNFNTIESGVKAALDAKADIVVVCSADEAYAEIVPQVFEGLGDKAITVVAGNPECAEELRSKGIQNFIHVRSNLLESLKEYHKLLGIE